MPATDEQKAELKQRYDEIETRYANATKDREIAILFRDSGLTQQEIADTIGRSVSWVSDQLRFGEFISFSATAEKDIDVTEWAFRGHWRKTDEYQSKDDRFRDVCIRLGWEPPAPPTPVIAPRPVLNTTATRQDNMRAAQDALLDAAGITFKASKYNLAKWLLTEGHENIIEMVRTRRVKLGPAAYYVHYSGISKARQAEVTAAEVTLRGRELMNNNPNSGASGRTASPRAARSRSQTPPVPAANQAPHVPPPPDLRNLDIGDERIPGQPVQLMPAYVQRLREAQIRLTGIATLCRTIATHSLESFPNDIAKLLAHVPVPGKTNGEQENYARPARQSLTLLDENIDAAIAKLEELRELRIQQATGAATTPQRYSSAPGGNRKSLGVTAPSV